MMKKMLGFLLAALILICAVVSSMAEDELPEPEGGKKFNGDWAVGGGLIEINYEEEGYRVSVDLCNNEDWSGTIWEYSCYYAEKEDRLESVSTSKRTYTTDPVSRERIEADVEYEGLDLDDQGAFFSISENGSLIWADSRNPDAGADLEFRYIGRFAGSWRSAEGEEPVTVEFKWMGLDQENYCYSVYLHRGDDAVYSDFIMTGNYNEENGKLECSGRCVDEQDTEVYEAFFSMTENGQLLYEAANGILLDYDFLGGSNG